MLHSDENLITTQAPSKKRTVNLLPSLDPTSWVTKNAKDIFTLNIMTKSLIAQVTLHQLILLDGRVIGVWDFADDAEPSVKLFLFEEVEGSVLREIHLEARKIGKFIADKEVQIKECESMVPLTRRTAGGVMSPLKGC